MKAIYPILLTCGIIFPVSGQTLKNPKEGKVISEEVQNAIEEFNRLKRTGEEKPAEVTVVLPPPVSEKASLPDEEESAAGSDEASPETADKPILVTGKPPEEQAETADKISAPSPTPDEISESAAESDSTSKKPGLEIRVESIRKGTGKLDPNKINLRASFPAKPLSNPPEGWIMEKTKDAPAMQREVEIQPGTVVSLDIKPHVLIPNADGVDVFAVAEPGFIAPDGYRQQQTVSAILAKSVVQLDEDAKQLGSALDELNRILSSLPQPEPKATPVEEVDQ